MEDNPRAPSRQSFQADPNAIHNHFHGPVNSASFGPNHGTIMQNAHPAAPLAAEPSRAAITGIAALLNPIYDASHTRNRRTSPPNSTCFPGTRTQVLQGIYNWSKSSLSDESQHILWVFGYAGCGKSAIAQAIAVQLAGKLRLGASFFFFRGAGHRSKLPKFAATIASQIAVNVPGTVPHIEAALQAHPGILNTTTSLVVQLKLLVYDPIRAVAAKWYRPLGVWGPLVIVIDGLDECEDKDGVSDFIKDLISFFERKPSAPLRFVITSRVEDHLHQRLHNSTQVRLLNLVDHTSDRDIETALDAAIEDARGSRVLDCVGEWLSPADKRRLIAHIGGSFIFMTTIAKFLFAPYNTDGRTPASRLPLALNMNPGFDGLYGSILAGSRHLPHFSDIISTIALVWEALSVAQIADLLSIETSAVVLVLVDLHAIIQVPGDDHTPITLWHTSLRDFLTSETRSGPFFAHPAHHESITLKCVDLVTRSKPASKAPALPYARQNVGLHFTAFIRAADSVRVDDLYSKLIPCVERDQYAFYTTVPSDSADEFCRRILSSSQHIPHLYTVIGTITIAQRAISIAQISDLLDIGVAEVSVVLKGLHTIFRVPNDDLTPVTLWHEPIRNFLASVCTSPTYHRSIAYRHISLCASSIKSPAFLYCRRYAGDHWGNFLQSVRHDLDLLAHELDSIVAFLRKNFPLGSDIIVTAYFHMDWRFFSSFDSPRQILRLVLDDLFRRPLIGDTTLAFLVTDLLDAVMASHADFPGRKDAVEYSIHETEGSSHHCANFHHQNYIEGLHRELHAHMQQSHPQLSDPSHHLEVVMGGIPLLVQLIASGGGLIFHSRGDHPGYAGEYMFTCWARYLALAIQDNPQHPAFDAFRPTLIPITGWQSKIVHYELPLKFIEVAESNLRFAEKTVKEFVGPQALIEGNQWEWDVGYGPRAYVKGGNSVTVYDVLHGLRGLFSCYRSKCPHVVTRKCPFIP